jgi:hypothetical protein
MNSFIAALAATLSRLTLTLSASVLVACLLSSPAFADELKDIFQMQIRANMLQPLRSSMLIFRPTQKMLKLYL